jgi:hypothetical protein
MVIRRKILLNYFTVEIRAQVDYLDKKKKKKAKEGKKAKVKDLEF